MAEPEAPPLSRMWFRDRRQLNAVGGTYDELVYTPLLEKDYIQFTRIGVEDESNTCTKIRVYVRGHGYDHPVAEETSITAGVSSVKASVSQPCAISASAASRAFSGPTQA